MLENNIPNNSADPFCDAINKKLANHQIFVDDTCWCEIDARLNGKKKKRIIPFLLWISGGATVAAVFALLFLFRKDDMSPTCSIRTNKTTAKIVQDEKPFTKKALGVESLHKENSIKQISSNRSVKKEICFSEHQGVYDRKYKENGQDDGLINNVETVENVGYTDKDQELIDENKSGSLNANELAANENSVKIDTPSVVIQEKMNKRNSLVDKSDSQWTKKTKNKNNWLLAAAFGSGGNVSVAGLENNVEYDDMNAIVDASPSYTSIMKPEDFTSTTYELPLSLGISVRKYINNAWSVESGLSYTYLLTTFEKSGTVSYNARLRLHYLGIPINMVVRIINHPDWEVYVSGGGMVEKGLRSVYIQNQQFGNQTYTTDVRSKIDGLQWSLNGAMGFSYKIRRNVGLYFEPKVSYFFDNDQPISARTDQPLVVGLVAGVSFEL